LRLLVSRLDMEIGCSAAALEVSSPFKHTIILKNKAAIPEQVIQVYAALHIELAMVAQYQEHRLVCDAGIINRLHQVADSSIHPSDRLADLLAVCAVCMLGVVEI